MWCTDEKRFPRSCSYVSALRAAVDSAGPGPYHCSDLGYAVIFEQHGIKHLSPSSLNAFISHPGIWALTYLARERGPGNPKMWRGSAVEGGYVHFLRTGQFDASCEAAYRMYWLNVDENNARGEEADKQAELIDSMLAQAVLWTPPSDLNAHQIKVEHWFDDVPVPVVGYVDLAFEGIDVDLKTTQRMPPKPSNEHVRQVSLYRVARNKPGGLLYVTDKRYQYFAVDDDMMAQGLSALEDAARKVTTLLTRLTTEEILSILPIDYDHYRAPKEQVGARKDRPAASDQFEPVILEE